MPAALHACRPAPGSPARPYPGSAQRLGAPAAGGSPSGLQSGDKGVSQEWGALKSDPGGRAGLDLRPQLITIWVSLFWSPSPYPSPPHPDTLPVLGPGHQPNHPAPRAGGQSIPRARPAGLPTSPALVSGQTRTADIFYRRTGGGLLVTAAPGV